MQSLVERMGFSIPEHIVARLPSLTSGFASFPMPELSLHFNIEVSLPADHSVHVIQGTFHFCHMYLFFTHSPAFLEVFSVLYATRLATMPDSFVTCGLDVDVHSKIGLHLLIELSSSDYSP